MSEVELGKIITGPGAERDAIHFAVVPVLADCQLYPGQHVGPVPGDPGTATCDAVSKIGIVDPFLVHPVMKGQAFWLVLYPGTVTGMRHHWSHPAFDIAIAKADSTTEVEKSKAWLMSAAMQLGVSYDDLVSDRSDLVNSDYINNGEHIRDIWYDIQDEFWRHRKIVTGVDVEDSDRGGFTCSC